MLTPKLPEKPSSLVALPQPIQVVLAEDQGGGLSLVLPPTEDLRAIESLKGANFSISEITESALLKHSDWAQEEYSSLATKLSKYGESPIYLHRLAILAAMAGKTQDEATHRRDALSLGKNGFYAHEYGDFLLAHGRSAEAEALFGHLNLSSDLAANLRLAWFCVQKGDLLGADSYVRTAIDIDPLDFGARLFHGGLALYAGDYRGAVQNFKLALNERPTSSVAQCNLAISYLALGEEIKALGALRRSVALDPLNSNAVTMLADLAFVMERDEEAVPSLRYFLQLEQKNEGVWSRMARACFRMGSVNEAYAALKRQASIRQSAGVWNNLGVAHLKLGHRSRGFECFMYAMNMDQNTGSRDYFLAARNAASLLSESESYSELESIAVAAFESANADSLLRDESAADLITFYVHALFMRGKRSEASEIAKGFLSFDDINDSLALWLVGWLVSYQSLHGLDDEALSLIKAYESLPLRLAGQHNAEQKLARYYNNVAFALIEMGELAAAEQYLGRILHWVHRSAYPTATFGLLQLRKGRTERAKSLYEEAIGLATNRRDKSRIRQKMNLELAKVYLPNHPARANRLLEKVLADRSGEEALVKQARALRSGTSPGEE